MFKFHAIFFFLFSFSFIFHVHLFDFSKGGVGTNITINTLCDIMNNADIGEPLARYAKVNSLALQTYGSKCLDSSYKSMITSLQNTSWDSAASEGGRGRCNPF